MMVGGDTIRVLIADDHALVRQGLRRVLAEDPALVVVAEAATGHEILSLALEHRPDVLLLDLNLPGQSGLEALRQVRAHMPCPPRAIVLSAFRHEEYVRRAREFGVAGFLSKSGPDDELRRAIRRVMAGETVFDPAVAAIVEEQRYSGRGRFQRYTDGSEPLSAAELDVLRRMVGEESYAEIATVLGRGYRTVCAQAKSVYDKLSVNNRQQAVLKALELGILRLPRAHHDEDTR